MQGKLCFCVFLFVFHVAHASENTTPTNDEIEAKIKETLENYLKDLARESNLGFTVVLSREKYYANGTVQQVDSAAISSNAENHTLPDNFDLGNISKENLKKIVTDGEGKRILVSAYQQKTVNNTKKSTFFDTKEMHATTTAAAKIPLHMEGFETGLQTQVCDAMDMTDNVAVLQILELSENSKIRKNITATVFSNKVAVKGSYKMSARMVQEAAETLKKAYKIDVDDRTPLIAELFDQKFPKYNWQVLKSAGEYLMTKDVMVNLVVEEDNYHIIGVKD